MKKRRRNWIVVGAIAAVLIVAVIGLRWVNDPVRVASVISHLDLPRSMKLVHEDKRWDEFLGDGYSLWVFEVTTEFESSIIEKCGALGYTRGHFANTGLQLTEAEKYFDRHAESCYSLRRVRDGIELSLMSAGRLIVYVDSS